MHTPGLNTGVWRALTSRVAAQITVLEEGDGKAWLPVGAKGLLILLWPKCLLAGKGAHSCGNTLNGVPVGRQV